MDCSESYIDINRTLWNNKVGVHYASDFYNVSAFISGKSSLNQIELELLGDLRGKSILHLQCHFGQDSISLARLGADVTAVDLSDQAIEKAKELASITNVEIDFICTDIYNLPALLQDKFDIVFTSYGTIGWLPDIKQWGNIISLFLKTGGNFVFAEFHPLVWMFDDRFKEIKYSYFNGDPIRATETGTYAEPNSALEQQYVCWNHGLSEVITALIENNLEIASFKEYDYSPYNCFGETEEYEPGRFRIRHLENHIPMVYSILATAR